MRKNITRVWLAWLVGDDFPLRKPATPLIIWLVSLIAGLVLPLVLFRKVLEKKKDA